MTKLLTPLQNRIVARVLSQPITQALYLREGRVSSIKNMQAKGYIDPHAYTGLHYHHLTDLGKQAFFKDNGDVFYVQDLYDPSWIIFEDGEVAALAKSERSAQRIAGALRSLRCIAA